MKFLPTLALAAVSLVVARNAQGAPGAAASVADAQKNLDAARTKLTKAVERIQVEPPATEDLDAAFTAVNELKDAIDFGAAKEPEDLDYAKAALAARKELRTQREYVDQRRAKVHIFKQRRVIDAAVATLNERAKAVAEKEPSQSDFENARAAVKALKAAVDESRQFAPQDATFASYLTQTDATLTRQQKAIDDRFVLLQADKHRALVEEARRDLSAAMGALGKTSTDEQFKTADTATAALEKRLEEGKPLEAEKNYRAISDKARAEVAEAKKKKDLLWSETGLNRLKAEIEPAYKDLQAAARVVRGRKPNADQLAEARTVSIVVRKLVEKFAPEAARSEAFGQYVEQVKGTLVEVEVQLQLRGLEAAKTDVNKALRNIEKKNPTDDHFAELNSALLVLEKTLETVHAKDPLMAAPAAEAKQMLHDGKWSMNKRRIEVDVEQQTAKVEDARNKAAVLLGQLSTLGPEKMAEVDAAIDAIAKALEGGVELAKKDRGYGAYDREVTKRVGEMKNKVAARRVVLSGVEGKTQLADALTQLKAAIETAKQPASTDADVDGASKKFDGILSFIESHATLATQDRAYAAYSERVQIELMRQQEALELARQARELRKKTGEALAAGEAAFSAAQASKELRTQKAQYEKAVALFKSCNTDGTSIVEMNPLLAKTVVLVDGLGSTPKAVAALCTQRMEATLPLIKPLTALISFDEGPKRAYEKAKAALAKNDKTEALAQFDECTATGLTVQHRNPELKDRSFEVAGTNITLVELTRQCTAQAKTLRGK